MTAQAAWRFVRMTSALSLCLASTANLQAISPEERLASLAISHWGAQSGIPEESFADILASGDGYVWLASNHGLVRFDGQQAETFRLGDYFRPKGTGACSNSSLYALLLGRDGNLWAGTASGCLFHIQRDLFGGFTNFRIAAVDAQKTPRESNAILDLRHGPENREVEIVRRTTIGIIRADAIASGSTGNLQPQLQSSTERLIYGADSPIRIAVSDRDRHLALWGLTGDGRLYHAPYRLGADPVWEPAAVLPDAPHASPLRIHAARNGDIWIATTTGVVMYRGGAFRSWTAADGLPRSAVFSLHEDAAGCMWLGMSQNLGRICAEKLETIPFGTAEEERMYTITEDPQGNIWIGGGWGNLYRISSPIFQNFTRKEGLPESHFTGVTVDRDGVVWGSTSELGLVRLAEGRLLEHVRGPDVNRTQALLPNPDGGVLAAGPAGIFYVDKKGTRPLRLEPELKAPAVSGMAWESPGKLLISNVNGNYRLTATAKGTWRVQPLDGAPRMRQWATDPGGRTWAIAQFEGLHLLNGDTYSPPPNATPGKARAWYNIVSDAEGLLWIGTTDGLEIYSTAEKKYLTDKPLLFGDQVFHIAEDRFGKIWCATRLGLVRFARSQALLLAERRRTEPDALLFFERFGEAQSLPTTNFGLVLSATGATGMDGRIWFPGLLALVSVQPADFERAPRPPVAILRHIKSDNVAQDLNRPINIAPGTKTLEIRYQTIRQDPLGGNFCRLRLGDFDPDWQVCNDQRTAQYTNLPPGTYEFVLQTSSQAGVWNGKELRVPVAIQPAFHQRLWVRLLGIALLLAGVGIFHLQRERLLAERTRILEERVEERTANLARAMHAAEAASRTKSQFLATMSHEIRTPMNGVLGALQILGESPLDQEQRKLVSVIRQSGEDLVGIVDDILNLAKVEAGKLSLERAAVNITALGEGLVTLFRAKAETKGVALEFIREPNAPESIASDPQRLRQILLNLVGNAVKFTNEGAVRLRVSADAESGLIVFHVEDSGIGIPADKLPTLFDPFVQADSSTTRRFGGSGLGLSIVRRFVDAMGGSIAVDSEPGRGSTFRVSLPFEPAPDTPPAAEPPPPSHVPAETTGAGMTVLLAEDNHVNQMIFQKMLLRLGCQVIIANHGREALDALRGGSIDLVLMDCQMPELDGYQTTREIRSWGGPYADLPVIALTASAMVEDRQNCFDAGMNDFLSKPLMLSSLAAAITQWGQRAPNGTPAATEPQQ